MHELQSGRRFFGLSCCSFYIGINFRLNSIVKETLTRNSEHGEMAANSVLFIHWPCQSLCAAELNITR
jgi:hypothetical protein